VLEQVAKEKRGHQPVKKTRSWFEKTKLFDEFEMKKLALEKKQNEIEWPMDSKNGHFSYTKMMFEIDHRHLRMETTATRDQNNQIQPTSEKPDEDSHYVPKSKFPLCGKGSHTGCFSGRKSLQESDIAKHCGLGISLYFKTLK